MQDYIVSLREELEEMRADMDELSKHGDPQEVLFNMEERYHRVKSLLNSLAGEDNE